MKTKEQILDEITGYDLMTDETYIDNDKLASYLYSIQPKEVCNCAINQVCSKCMPNAISYLGAAGGKIVECEHKHRGLYGECLKCTEKLDDPIEGWEKKILEVKRKLLKSLSRHNKWTYEDIETDIDEEVESFIKDLIEKEMKDWENIEGKITEFYDRNRNGKHDKNQLRRWKSFIRKLLNK